MNNEAMKYLVGPRVCLWGILSKTIGAMDLSDATKKELERSNQAGYILVPCDLDQERYGPFNHATKWVDKAEVDKCSFFDEKEGHIVVFLDKNLNPVPRPEQ
jgi:hypothetical protein